MISPGLPTRGLIPKKFLMSAVYEMLSVNVGFLSLSARPCTAYDRRNHVI